MDWFHIVWYPYAIHRHAFLLWLIMGEKLKTQDKLIERDKNPMLATVCSLCSKVADSRNHLFFECN